MYSKNMPVSISKYLYPYLCLYLHVPDRRYTWCYDLMNFSVVCTNLGLLVTYGDVVPLKY